MCDSGCRYDKENKCWRSAKRHGTFNVNLSAGELAFFMMRNKDPENVMQISDSEDTVLTYSSALLAAIRIAQHLDQLQLNDEDVISIFAPNSTYVMPVALAALFNGTPFQPMNTVMETDVVKQIFEKSRPKVIFCDGLHYEKLKKASEEFKPLIYTLLNHRQEVTRIDELLMSTKTEQHYKPKPLTKGPSQTQVIMLSSGTTGISKAVRLSNRFCTNLRISCQYDTAFTTCGIDWITGVLGVLFNVLVGGIRIITHNSLTAEYLLDIIVKYKITKLITNPSSMIELTALKACTRENLRGLRQVLMGGSHCAEKHFKQIRSVLTNAQLFFVYGNTELGGLACNGRNYKLKSVGQIVHNVEMIIVDPNTGERLGPNETGELHVKKTNDAWLGYYKNAEANAEAMDSEGFVRTGDMCYVDDEHYLFLVDRCQDFMKHMGYKWSPHEIEMIISEMPDVDDVCVFDVFDEIKLHVPAAAVVRKPGSFLSEDDVVKYVEERIEVHFKHLTAGAFILDKLPRNRNGKLMRNKIREICLARNLNAKENIER